jgi:predicted small metal-binding protein
MCGTSVFSACTRAYAVCVCGWIVRAQSTREVISRLSRVSRVSRGMVPAKS